MKEHCSDMDIPPEKTGPKTFTIAHHMTNSGFCEFLENEASLQREKNTVQRKRALDKQLNQPWYLSNFLMDVNAETVLHIFD